MSKKRAKTCCLVIDASIAHAAGTLESPGPTGTRCRDFLISVRGVCHRMAWSEAIQSEWNRHQSVFARQWLVSMMKLRKLRAVQEEQSAELREAIEQHSTDPKIVERMLKDTHLFEAALETDLRIVSGDENAHGHFRQLAVTFAPLPPILWVNPVTEGEKAMRWLEEGTPAQRSRRLKR